MKNMKQILIGAFSFITSCVMLTIILPIIDNINLSFMRVCIYLLLVIIISLFCFFLFKKYKLKKGYFILAILPFIISVCLLPIGWVVQHENRNIYHICDKDDTQEFCQCKVDFMRSNLSQNSWIFEKIDKDFKEIAHKLEDKEENVFLKGKSECEKLFNRPHTD